MASAHIPELQRTRKGPGLRRARLRSITGGASALAPAALQPLVIADLIDPGAIASRASVASKRQVLSLVADLAARAYHVSAPATLAALMEREGIGSTGVGAGVAIPHAKLEGLGRMRAVFLRLSTPVEFHAVDDQPIDLVFALLGPPERGSEHLRALARIARMMRDRDFRGQLRAAPNAAALRALLVQETRSSAA